MPSCNVPIFETMLPPFLSLYVVFLFSDVLITTLPPLSPPPQSRPPIPLPSPFLSSPTTSLVSGVVLLFGYLYIYMYTCIYICMCIFVCDPNNDGIMDNLHVYVLLTNGKYAL